MILLSLALVVGCASTLDDLTPYVDEPRVLAVQVEPAEAEPEEAIHLRALYADQTGALSEVPVDWSFCLARRPLAELGPVAESCLDPESADLSSVGSGAEVDTQIPADTCSLFGPNPPDAAEGEPAGRPIDADISGGYYQPILGFSTAGASGELVADTLVSARVRCGLANVDQDTYVSWNQSYVNNLNPEIETVALWRESSEGGELLGGDAPVVAPGEQVRLVAAWPACPTLGACGGAETYVVYDVDAGALVERREAISAAWYTTGGAFALARAGVDGEDTVTELENLWTAPEEEGEVWLAVVLRDERGGVGYATFTIRVER